jgi:hypothetical protein
MMVVTTEAYAMAESPLVSNTTLAQEAAPCLLLDNEKAVVR